MADGRELVVRGGPGGTTAHLEDIARCATALRQAAQAVEDARSTLGGIQWELSMWGSSTAASSLEELRVASLAGQARLAVDGVRPGLLRLASALHDDGRDVDRARRHYEGAESFADKAFRVVIGSVFPFYGIVRYPAPYEQLPTLPVVLAEHTRWRAGQGVSADFVERYVNVFAAQLVRLSPGHLYVIEDDPVPIVAGWLAGLTGLFSTTKEVVVQPVIGGVRPNRPPRGAKDLANAFAFGRAADGRERVQITKVTNGDGSTAWEVTIPGTQTWSPVDGDHPNNLKSNFELLAGVPAHATAAVFEAMTLAGIGKDEPVVLAGHSQGGLIAQEIAASGAFEVAAVLTAGTPLGGRHQRATAPTLAIEHRSDLIAATDGKPNPDDPLTTTVHLPLEGKARQSPIASHLAAKYAETADVADNHSADSLVAWREILDETFDAGAVAETRLYDVSLKDPG